MALSIIRKANLQPPPRLTLYLNRRDLLGLETRIGIEKRSGQVSPQRFTAEVCDMNIVPGLLSLISLKGLLRIIASLDQRPVRLLHYDPLRLKHRPLILPRKIHHQPFNPRIASHDDVLQIVKLSLHIPKPTTNRSRHLHRLHLVPTLKPTVRSHCQIQKLAHHCPPLDLTPSSPPGK